LVRVPAILLLGPTGSGKSPLGELLERAGLNGRRCRHFDFGARLRAAAASEAPPGFTSHDLEVIRGSLSTGALFEDADFPVAVKVFRLFAASTEKPSGELIILNGFPRHLGQAQALEGDIAVEKVVVLEAPAEVVADRIRLNAGGDRGGRADDSPAEIRKKLATFDERTLPLVAHYASRGARIVRIPVSASSTAEDHLAAVLEQLT
jgi:adenylate kinase